MCSIADEVSKNEAAADRNVLCFGVVGAVGIIAGQLRGVLNRLVRTKVDIEACKGIVEGCQRTLHVGNTRIG
jgi:hypothetical protein